MRPQIQQTKRELAAHAWGPLGSGQPQPAMQEAELSLQTTHKPKKN